MMTVPGRIWKKRTAENNRCWTEKHSAVAFCVFACLTYFVFFSPILRYDGIPYVSPARSLVFDQDLNTYNESFYYSIPGWNDILNRQIKGYNNQLIGYVFASPYTTRGYRYVVFPIGNALTWFPAIIASHTIWSGISRWNSSFSADGFSLPYIIALGWWSFLIGWGGMVAAYRIMRFWYSPGLSCGSTLFIYASSNIIPFLTRDVTFSHSVDFLLVNLSILVFLRIYKNSTPLISMTNLNTHVLWGMLIGYACIVRYQDVVLLLLPLVVYLSKNNRRSPHSWKQPACFLSGFLFTTGLQLLYWKILYGTCLISTQTMGTGNLASFNPLKPQILPMLFSRFHGVYNWMPWLLPITIGFFLFIKRDKKIAVLFNLLIASQFYYISSRSEWWNLGFSVRRITGWLIVFMIGTAEIIAFCKKKFLKTSLFFLSIPIVAWAWLFLINYQIQEPEVNILHNLIGDATPFVHDNFKPIIPTLSVFTNAFKSLKIWFFKYALIGELFKSIQNQAYLSAGTILIYNLLFVSFCCGFIMLLFSKKTPTKQLSLKLFSAYIILFYALMIISDCSAEDIEAQRIVKGEVASGFQRIRIHNASGFEGENSILSLTHSPIKFEYPSKGEKATGYCLIGLPACSDPKSAVVDVTLVKNDKKTCWMHFRLDDETDERVFELHKPWGDIEYLYRWFRIEMKLDIDDGSIPDACELSLVRGEGVVIGAFWHSYE